MDYKPSFIPTLDISKGQAVLVKHGNVYKVLGDPMEKAKFISIGGHFQVIDIDAAKGEGSNKDLIKQIVKKYPHGFPKYPYKSLVLSLHSYQLNILYR